MYITYKPRSPVYSTSLYVIKGSNSLKPDGVQPRLMGVEERIVKATTMKTSKAPLMVNCKRCMER